MRQTFSDTIISIADTAERLRRRRSRLPQNTSVMHMLKNEMSKIQLAVRLIRERDSRDIAEELDIIEHAALRVEEFALRSSASSGGIRIVAEETDICALMRDTVREQTHGWSGTTEFHLEAETAALYCDPYHMKEVLCNLISNALEAMGEDGILRITYQTAGKQVRISVSDTGCGIENQALKHIFDLYYTGHPDRSHFGTGLPYCRDVVRKHGGSIRVVSSTKPENHGTEIILCLPRTARRGKGKDEDCHKGADRRG